MAQYKMTIFLVWLAFMIGAATASVYLFIVIGVPESINDLELSPESRQAALQLVQQITGVMGAIGAAAIGAIAGVMSTRKATPQENLESSLRERNRIVEKLNANIAAYERIKRMDEFEAEALANLFEGLLAGELRKEGYRSLGKDIGLFIAGAILSVLTSFLLIPVSG